VLSVVSFAVGGREMIVVEERRGSMVVVVEAGEDGMSVAVGPVCALLVFMSGDGARAAGEGEDEGDGGAAGSASCLHRQTLSLLHWILLL